MRPETRKAIAEGRLRLVVDNPRRVPTVPSIWPFVAWTFALSFLAGGLAGWVFFRELYRVR